jgi:hypothetical protein
MALANDDVRITEGDPDLRYQKEIDRGASGEVHQVFHVYSIL